MFLRFPSAPSTSPTPPMSPATIGMVALVQTMLDLHKALSSAGPDHERTLLARRIEATDRQIDALVYELYGLTEEEIGIVEAASR